MNPILNTVKELQPGQRVEIGLGEIRRYYRPYMHRGAVFSPEDQLLENIMGSSFEYGYQIHHIKQTVTFFRLEKPIEEFDTFSYVSPDRRQYYSHDGSLYRRNKTPYQG